MTGTGVGPVILALDDVTVAYEDAHVLHDISFHVHADQFTGIVGPSGSGKTTLLRTLLGALQPQRGRVTVEPGLRMAYVPQLETVNWNFPVTVFECVLMARTQGGSGRGRAAPTRSTWPPSSSAWASTTSPSDTSASSPVASSNGCSSPVPCWQPQLLVLDEPTSGVDVSTRHDMLHLLADLHEDGISIVLTTHDLNGMAAHLPHLVTVNGRIVAEGTPQRSHHP